MNTSPPNWEATSLRRVWGCDWAVGHSFQNRKSVWLPICKLHFIKSGITQGLLFAKPTKGILTAGAASRSPKSAQSTFLIQFSVWGEEVFFCSEGTENRDEVLSGHSSMDQLSEKWGMGAGSWGPSLASFSAPLHSTPSPRPALREGVWLGHTALGSEGPCVCSNVLSLSLN